MHSCLCINFHCVKNNLIKFILVRIDFCSIYEINKEFKSFSKTKVPKFYPKKLVLISKT